MKMTNFEMVKRFHERMELTVNKKPTIPDPEDKALRLKLIREEWVELGHELQFTDNIEHIAKEMADLLYVIYGTAVSYGIPIDDVFKEVHRSNMSKLDDNGKPIKNEDGKVIKGPNYTPANVSNVLKKFDK